MSLAEYERECVNRLARLFESGITHISCTVLFEGMTLNNSQKYSICELLREKQLINPLFQMGQQLPYQIEILPCVLNELPLVQTETYIDPNTGYEHRSTIISAAPFEPENVDDSGLQQRDMGSTLFQIAKLWFGDPSTRFPKYLAVAGVTLIAARWWQPVIQQLAVEKLGVDATFLANADNGMFWSGWVLICIALTLYIWIKRSPPSN